MKDISYKTKDGITLSGKMWECNNIKAIVHITHGMTEHIARYDVLAKKLNEHGILVFGYDLRGHGNNNLKTKCGTFKEGGWQKSIEDMQGICTSMKEQYPLVPYYMFGFSLGSFLLREYLETHSNEIDGAIIVGTGQQPAFLLKVIISVVKSQIKKHGFDESSSLVHKLLFGTYNAKFAPNKTKSDWLIKDEKERYAYLEDDLCKENVSAGLFYQMLDSMKKTGEVSTYINWNKDLPVLLLSGKEDAVGECGKGVLLVEKTMKKAGLQNIEMHLFENARHDLFHEMESGAMIKATQVLINWITKK